MDRDKERERSRKYYAEHKEAIKQRRRERYAVRSSASANQPSSKECVRTHRRTREEYETDVSVPEPTKRRARQSMRENDDRLIILPRVRACQFCGAFKFYKETENSCCMSGKVVLAETELPKLLVDLITGTSAMAKAFQSNIRSYNNNFAYTSIGMHCDEHLAKRTQGIYTVKVQGQVYHFLEDLMPHPNAERLSGLQFYFYDPDHQVENRLSAVKKLDPSLVAALVDLLHSNPYSQFLQRVSTLPNPDDYHIAIRSDAGLDQRRYNRPTSNEVAGIWIEKNRGEATSHEPCDMRVYTSGGKSQKVKNHYSCYDPLQYVLMFPNGEPGWCPSILRNNDSERHRISRGQDMRDVTCFEDIIAREEEGRPVQNYDDVDFGSFNNDEQVNRKRKTVSCREYYVYKLQIRKNDRSHLLHFGRLLQQYVVDNYIKLESMRLQFLRQHQKNLRRENYQGVVDSVESGQCSAQRIGTRIYLPATFIGGPRNMKARYLDSMALVQEFGRPDIFLTMTCNPSWPEITEHLLPGEESQNRPDLVARVFKAKLAILNERIMSGEIFGEVASMVHVIEFQKRGLPHAHVLIILKPHNKYLTPNAYDRVVSAELPNREDDPYLYSLVVKHMLHGPCGDMNPGNSCMIDGQCKNHYPKVFTPFTEHGKGTYPRYRRRNDGQTALVRRQILDNRWVVPYNPTLLANFDCHMNVEVVGDIRAVKYLYKYVHKGHDKVMFKITPNDDMSTIDEIKQYRNARWVSPVEAVWRIFGFPLSNMHPAVLQLQVHLPNFQAVHFAEDTDLQKVLQNERFQRTMLTEFFRTNSIDVAAMSLNLLYKDFPRHYVWDQSIKRWKRRKRSTVIGRLCTVYPMENERYYLRVLLSNIRCPKSFEDLLTVGGTTYSTFQEAAFKRGLLHNDDDVEQTMEEASIFRLPPELRRLFATLLHYCKPADPSALFNKFYEHMAEDFKRVQQQGNYSDEDVLYKVLQSLNDTLGTFGREVNDFRLTSFQYHASEQQIYTREVIAERSLPVPEEDLLAIHQLNPAQKHAFDTIFNKFVNNESGAFFVDGPGGTGKSFLYKVILAHIRSQGCIAIIVASSGIAASNFLGGRTAHSRFKLPIDITDEVKCNMPVQGGEAGLLRTARIIIWDEATMAHRYLIEAVDAFLKEICDNDLPFGGKLVVFGGDFRQVLPVVRRGSRRELIDASLVSSDLWIHFTRLQLVDNVRAKDDPTFTNFLMHIGNGTQPSNDRSEIRIPRPMLVHYTGMESSIENLISYVYPNMNLFKTTPYEMMKRTILCPKNDFVDDINNILIERLPGKEYVYISDDRAKNHNDQGDYIDYLNTLEPQGLPQHRLTLKENAPVILLRNINPVEGLCNGTRLICTKLMPNVVGAEIATGQFKGNHVWIPRIPLEPKVSDIKYAIPFTRRQIPLKLCFAMTVNKAQGQTLDRVGIYLKQPVFSHGQLYVALSRARTGSDVRILIAPPTGVDKGSEYTSNIVFHEVLEKATSN